MSKKTGIHICSSVKKKLNLTVLSLLLCGVIYAQPKTESISVQLSEHEENVAAGGVVYVPRFTQHGFRNNTEEPVKFILVYNPAQKREGFFEGLYEVTQEDPVDPDKFLSLYHKYDSCPVDSRRKNSPT